MRLAIALVVLSVAASNAAWASQADVCYSTPTPSDQASKLLASTPLDCPVAGRHGLDQLAQGGWSVVAVQPVVTDYAADPATHAPRSATSWMVVVQKGAH
ncbi:MAG: hypothetical protein AAGC76_05375 [Luteibacter sp.]|uniref:hypothetical protein n=1 Tax=Luteibacter sp. TaxID=1886636 RepID=UPI00280667AD|nr:hypothetical protein [Luteibacter sp.]MDQ7995268.1 hypothetical protein [Luteibacter sp.]